MGDQSVDRQGPHSGFRGKYFSFPKLFDNSLEIKLEEEEEVIVTHLHALFM